MVSVASRGAADESPASASMRDYETPSGRALPEEAGSVWGVVIEPDSEGVESWLWLFACAQTF